jgi:predicted ABC-class ATPase
MLRVPVRTAADPAREVATPWSRAVHTSRQRQAEDHVGDEQALHELLAAIEGRGYGAWRRLLGTWALAGLRVEVEKVQADPFAPPSRLAVRCPADRLALPGSLLRTPTRRRALADHLLRCLGERLTPPLHVDVGGQEVLERTAIRVTDGGDLVLRMSIELPDRRRKVRTSAVATALLEELPAGVDALAWDRIDQDATRRFVEVVEDAVELRKQLAARGLVAFVADGAVLARRSGVDERPADPAAAIPFVAPDDLAIELTAPNRGPVRGMGVGVGVTLIAGGGFHGKTTLLHALRAGVYDHVPDDGRELVVTRRDAVTIRAEDGRRVEHVDVSPFISAVPDPVGLARGGDTDGLDTVPRSDTSAFRSDDASGSTSQAAAIIEAIEAGTGLLLIDEDTAATNLMARDRRMEALIGAEDPGDGDRPYAHEPITPYVDLVRSLAVEHGVSTVLVVGATGDYLEVADRVIQMDAFRARDVTERAHWLSTVLPGRPPESTSFPAVPHRVVDPASVDARRGGRLRTRVLAPDRLQFGEQQLDLGALEQLVDRSQAAGVAAALVQLVEDRHLDGTTPLRQALDSLFDAVDRDGLDVLRRGRPGDLARPRPAEVAAALNRLRSLWVLGYGSGP